MRLELRLEPPTPLERVQNWAHWAHWQVFGDYLPGMPSWSINVHEDGRITANSEQVHGLELGKWRSDGTDVIIEITHDYPTSHD